MSSSSNNVGGLEVLFWDASEDEGIAGPLSVVKELREVGGVAQIAVPRLDDDEEQHQSGRLALLHNGQLRHWGPLVEQDFMRINTFTSYIGDTVVNIACGSDHSVAVTKSGGVFSWGTTSAKEYTLGHGRGMPSQILTPTRIEALDGICITNVACGSGHTVALTGSGTVYSWGRNVVAGHGWNDGITFTPKPIESLLDKRIVQIAAQSCHTTAVSNSGELYTWGWNSFGRLGHGGYEAHGVPKLVEGLKGVNVSQASAGDDHTSAVTDVGQVYMFGANDKGQLGIPGDGDDKYVPVLLDSLAGYRVRQVSCGDAISVALTHEGEVFYWGLCYEQPRKASKLNDYRVVSVGSSMSYCWAMVEASSMALDNTPLHVSLRSLVNNDEFADVAFEVEGERIYAHRANLVMRSPLFQTMFRSGMSECRRDGVIPMPDISKQCFLLLLEYLYTDRLDVLPFEVAFELWGAADMHGLKGLKNLCYSAVQSSLDIENAADLLQMAAAFAQKHHDCIDLKRMCLKYVVLNYDKVSETEGMRAITDSTLLSEIEDKRQGMLFKSSRKKNAAANP
ncbi:hypothetical protein ACA910_018023 [Epithemia clementina (nom. ined.)]